MMFDHRRIGILTVALLCAASLAACGGGGGGSTTPTAPGITVTPTPVVTASPSPTPVPVVTNGSGAATLLNEDPNTIVGDTAASGTIVGAPGTATIDGIPCVANATIATHYHVHVSLFVDGHQDAIPAGTGINTPTVFAPAYFVEPASTGCAYFIHVHALMGMVHIESTAANAVLTLGQFLDIWGKTMTTSAFASFPGTTRWFDTDETTGTAGTHPVTELTGTDPHSVNLVDHHEYTIEVGPTFVGTPNITWSPSYS